jgi:predicted nucleotidyltransferase
MATAPPISADEQRLRAWAEPPESPEPFLQALDDTLAALDGAGIGCLLMGGIASTTMGRARWTHDIDLFVRPEDARAALAALRGKGFETEETFPDWLFKAQRDGQLVDVIFRSAGDIYLDDEMERRAPTVDFMDRRIRVVPPEDLLVIKAVVHAEPAPRHWHDALAIVASTDLDWDYLIGRARHGIRRVLALLLYAQSDDLPVPWWVVERLHVMLRDGR